MSFTLLALNTLQAKTPEITHVVDLGFKIGDDEELHHLKLGLFGKETPKTVENFVQIAQMHRDNKDSTNMGYEHTISHRLIKNFMIQFGDFNHHDGTGGYSIYGSTFKDENFNVKFANRKHLLAMANRGRDTNGAQCFVTFTQTPWLEGGYVVFGVALKESQQTLDLLEQVQTNRMDRPLKDVEIFSVNVEKVENPFKVDFETA